jgi:hypothetical protein
MSHTEFGQYRCDCSYPDKDASEAFKGKVEAFMDLKNNRYDPRCDYTFWLGIDNKEEHFL